MRVARSLSVFFNFIAGIPAFIVDHFAERRMWSVRMFRFILILLAVAALAGFIAWLIPSGIIETLLMAVVGVDVIILLFAAFIAVAQRVSPMVDETPSSSKQR
jgi:hypothetical protein